MTDVFLDTNVLVYAAQQSAAHHKASRQAITDAWSRGDTLWISRQVMREYFATVTRVLPRGEMPVHPHDASRTIQVFATVFRLAEDGAATTQRLVSLIETHAITGRAIHDANIVATMLAHGVTDLLTFNVRDFRRYAPAITVHDPGGAPLPPAPDPA